MGIASTQMEGEERGRMRKEGGRKEEDSTCDRVGVMMVMMGSSSISNGDPIDGGKSHFNTETGS